MNDVSKQAKQYESAQSLANQMALVANATKQAEVKTTPPASLNDNLYSAFAALNKH